MPTESWRERLIWGCPICGMQGAVVSLVYKHPYDCTGEFAPVAPVEHVMYWYLLQEVHADYRKLCDELNADAD